jgi:peptidoglycan/xylan/chitin deacetylase (PgdA/CDA1 family)
MLINGEEKLKGASHAVFNSGGSRPGIVNIALILDCLGSARGAVSAASRDWTGMRSFRACVGVVFALSFAVGGGFAAAVTGALPARAEECPGNPGALGTSRVLAIDPAELSRVGRMQYPQSLPLADKEVVITFDDGPMPRYSIPILDILAAQCVRATYFLVGEMARAYPATVRRIYEAGHSIGTHTEDHPSRLEKLPIAKVRQEIDEGIADVGAALGDPSELAPFFRIPGLARSDAIEQELAARSLVVFSSDTVADDWHHRIRPAEIVRRAVSRLEARGKGILLLHDIHAATVAALPSLLKELKDAGFHVVHVVPATEHIEIATDPAHWPEVATQPTPDRVELPSPDLHAFAADYRPWRVVVLADGSASAGYLALAAVTQWSDPPGGAPAAAEPQLPAPALADVGDVLGNVFFELQHTESRETTPPSPAAAEPNAPADDSGSPAPDFFR